MQITENIVKLLNIKTCTIFLLDKTRNKLDVSASHGLSEAYLRKGPLDADKSIDDEYELISGVADMGGIAIDNARMHDRLRAEHEKLIDETHRWFEYGKV